MAKFLGGNELNSEIERILENAKEKIILISPYIKLHDRYASVLRTKKDNPNLKITIVFGKNEEDISRSMKQDDFNFFKEFPNIQIRYEKRLHAKYYANESAAIMTSMNLYSYSQDNNIEAGVLTNLSLLGNFANKLWEGEEDFDVSTGKYFERVIDQSKLLFRKTPQFDNGTFGTGLNKKYLSSTEEDKLSDYFNDKPKYDAPNRRESSYEKKKVETPVPTSNYQASNVPTGYCIRTGKPIPFNQKHPMTESAYQSWMQFKNKEYPEKFCHFSGEPSNGETSYAKPILRKNWNAAKKTFNL